MSFCFFCEFFFFFSIFLVTAITSVEGTFQETFWSGKAPAFDSLCHCHLQCLDTHLCLWLVSIHQFFLPVDCV